MILNDLVQNGSKLNWHFSNNTSETVKLKSLQLVDGVNGQEGNIMAVDAWLASIFLSLADLGMNIMVRNI